MSNVRVGIVGLSWIGADPAGPASAPELGTAVPYSHASAMDAIADIEVVAACDLDPDRRRDFVERWSNRWPRIETYGDIDEMLTTQLDLVALVTPDHLHGQMLLRCLDAGVPMLFSEKPFTTDLAEADAVLDRIARTGATVSVNHTWRWRPDIAETVAIAREGRYGPISQIIVEAGGPRAMLFRNLSHFVDLAIHLHDAAPVWVSGLLETGSRDYGTRYAGDGGRDPRLDPGALSLIGFSDGTTAFVSGLKSSVADVSINVAFRDARITIDALGARVVAVPRTGDGTPGGVSGPILQPLKPRATRSGMVAGLIDLIDSHRAGREPTCSAQSARSTVAVLDAILRSNAGDGARVDLRRHTQRT
ncbi:MAG: Gfo/Idh/MocA family protein [Acidimicrobiia bacterium]